MALRHLRRGTVVTTTTEGRFRMTLLETNTYAAPGWVALALVVVLALALVFLFFSMRKQLNRIDVPVDADHPEAGPFSDPRSTR